MRDSDMRVALVEIAEGLAQRGEVVTAVAWTVGEVL